MSWAPVAGFLFAVDPAHRVWRRPATAGNPATAKPCSLTPVTPPAIGWPKGSA